MGPLPLNTNPEIHERFIQAETISVLRWLIMKTGERDMHNQWDGNLPGTKTNRSKIGVRKGSVLVRRDFTWEMVGTSTRCHQL